MWCRFCQQDVPAIHGVSPEETCCARCQNPFGVQIRIESDSRPAEIENSIPQENVDFQSKRNSILGSGDRRSDSDYRHSAEQTDSNATKEPASSPRPAPIKSENLTHSEYPITARIDNELEKIDQIVNSWSSGKTLRLDTAHSPKHVAGEKPTEHSAPFSLAQKRIESRNANPTTSFVSMYVTGIIAFLGGAAFLMRELEGISQLGQVCIGLVLVGFSMVCVGAVFEISRLKRVSKRRATERITTEQKSESTSGQFESSRANSNTHST